MKYKVVTGNGSFEVEANTYKIIKGDLELYSSELSNPSPAELIAVFPCGQWLSCMRNDGSVRHIVDLSSEEEN